MPIRFNGLARGSEHDAGRDARVRHRRLSKGSEATGIARAGVRYVAAVLLFISAAVEPGANARPRGDARLLIARTLANLGAGRDAAGIATLGLHGREVGWDVVEDDHPMMPPYYLASDHPVTRVIDYRRSEQRTSIDEPEARITTLQSSRLAVTVQSSANNDVRRVSSVLPAWLLRDPIGALRLAAQSPDATLLPDVLWHGSKQHVVAFHEGPYPMRIWIDAAKELPSVTEALVSYDDVHLQEAIAWNALGDVVERTEYQNWVFADGLRYPFQQDSFRDGKLIRTLSVRELHAEAPLDDRELQLKPGEGFVPRSVQDLRFDEPVANGPSPGKPPEEIAPGVVQLPNSWYTTIVRQQDGVVIVDAPISAGYSRSVIAEVARRFPGARIKALITSTGFFWHVAGVREYAARGIPIYAETRNVPVIIRMLNARHRLSPDSLSRARGARIDVRAVSGRTALGKGMNAIILWPVSKATQPMLMSYIPDARLLHTAEMVQPLGPGGSILFPESLIELSQAVREQGLAPDRIIGMHMSPTPWSAIAKSLGEAGASMPRSPNHSPGS